MVHAAYIYNEAFKILTLNCHQTSKGGEISPFCLTRFVVAAAGAYTLKSQTYWGNFCAFGRQRVESNISIAQSCDVNLSLAQ